MASLISSNRQNSEQATLAKNNLLELLPSAERTRLLAISEPFDLVLSDVLCEPGAPTHCAYFPTEGFISLVPAVPGHPGVEVGTVGSEGLVGAYLALNVTVEPLHTVVQVAGSALRIATKPFVRELAIACEVIHRISLRSPHSFQCTEKVHEQARE